VEREFDQPLAVPCGWTDVPAAREVIPPPPRCPGCARVVLVVLQWGHGSGGKAREGVASRLAENTGFAQHPSPAVGLLHAPPPCQGGDPTTTVLPWLCSSGDTGYSGVVARQERELLHDLQKTPALLNIHHHATFNNSFYFPVGYMYCPRQLEASALWAAT
jgi:hypothetical protein